MTNEQHMPHGLLPRQVGILRQILSPYAQAITRVDLFGSRSGGRYRNNSDIDLVIHGDLLEKDIDRLHTLFQESALPFSVDVKSYALTQYAPLKQHMDMTQCTLFTKGDLVLHDAENESLQEHVKLHEKLMIDKMSPNINNIWTECTLGDFVALQRGHDLPDTQRKIGSVPILGSFGVTGYHDTAKMHGPGVTLGRSGTSFGVATYTDTDYWPLNTALYVTNFKGNNPYFTYCLFQSIDFSGFNSGSAQPSLNRNNIYPLNLVVPSPSEQEAIAHIFRNLDDRIQLLRETNATLEAMAQALFKSWFVDFDPVHAKAEGRAPEGMDAETAALFPAEFEESELGMIPMGWKIERVDEHIELAYGKALKQDQRIDGAIVVMGSNGKIGLHNKKIVTGPGIVVGRKGNPGTVTWVDDDFFPIDTTFYVVQKSDTPLSFWKYALTRLNLPSLAADSAVPGLNRNFVYSRLFCIPSGDILKSFDLIFQSIRSVIFKNCQTAYTLTALRDTLLPRLISGKLRLPEFAETTNAQA